MTADVMDTKKDTKKDAKIDPTEVSVNKPTDDSVKDAKIDTSSEVVVDTGNAEIVEEVKVDEVADVVTSEQSDSGAESESSESIDVSNETDAKEVTPETDEKLETIEAMDIDKTFKSGDKVVVNYKIIEGDKARIQPFEGIVIAKRGSGISKSFTVRRVSSGGIGVERIFQTYSPNIDSIKVKVVGRVRRAKLYYMRDRIGKAATKVEEKRSATVKKVGSAD